MSDPNNQYPAFNQSPLRSGPAGYPAGHVRPGPYGQAPQGVLRPGAARPTAKAPPGRVRTGVHVEPGPGEDPLERLERSSLLLPELRPRRNFSVRRHVVWANSMMTEAQSLGAPLDITTDLVSARNTAKICSIIHIVLIVVVVAF